ncbi:unnamed protein product [Auanema sp. JU1783]|nr:unnamed protein product [Auanema sp. JU1783]
MHGHYLEIVNETELRNTLQIHFTEFSTPSGNDSLSENNGELILGISAMPVVISILIISFIFLFIVGFFGNITVIYRMLRTQRECVHVYGKNTSNRIPIQKYVLFLALVDLIVTTMITMLIPYIYFGEWLFGAYLCKVFWAVDQLNKILSIHILTGMAIERYLIVRQSVDTNRSGASRCSNYGFYVCLIIALVLLYPIMTYAQIDDSRYIGVQFVTTCVSPMPDHLVELFTIFMFIFGYVIPGLIVTFCYVMLIRMLSKRYQLTQMSGNSKTKLVHKVSKSILYVTAFHFVCWTPFWLINLIPIIDHRIWKNGVSKEYTYGIFQIFSTICPYVNCSFNWCFYVLLNHRLRKQIFRRSSTHTSHCLTHTQHTHRRDDHSPLLIPIQNL